MSALWWIIGTTLVISLIAWIGILAFFLNEALLERVLLLLVALAAGAMLGGAFLHLLPNAIERYDGENTVVLFLWVLAGYSLFYVLEQFMYWHHHHGASHEHEPVTYLVLLSDTVHNFIDGLVVAGAFLVNVQVGLVTAVAIGLHEIPQEIGDFGVLVNGGFERWNALVVNYLTQSAVIVGGLVGFVATGMIDDLPNILLPLAAGNFIYIAGADLVPEIKDQADLRRAGVHFIVFLLGIVAMLGVRVLRGAL